MKEQRDYWSGSPDTEQASGWNTIKSGTYWKHNKTSKWILVIEKPTHKMGSVTLRHGSGKVTTKQNHYFLGEYSLIPINHT